MKEINIKIISDNIIEFNGQKYIGVKCVDSDRIVYGSRSYFSEAMMGRLLSSILQDNKNHLPLKEMDPRLNQNLFNKNIPERTVFALGRNGIKTIGDLLDRNIHSIRQIPMIGNAGINAILKMMEEYGYKTNDSGDWERIVDTSFLTGDDIDLTGVLEGGIE